MSRSICYCSLIFTTQKRARWVLFMVPSSYLSCGSKRHAAEAGGFVTSHARPPRARLVVVYPRDWSSSSVLAVEDEVMLSNTAALLASSLLLLALGSPPESKLRLFLLRRMEGRTKAALLVLPDLVPPPPPLFPLASLPDPPNKHTRARSKISTLC